MRLLAVSTSRLVEVPYRGGMMKTGIYKRPVEGRVWVSKRTVGDDEQADPRYHGGEDRAAYAYPFEHYAHFEGVLAHSAVHVAARDEGLYGLFGENFSTLGLDEATSHMGDVLRIGGATLQITEPRGPCFKLGYKLKAASFPKKMLAAGRLGFYLRVLEEGYVAAGDAITPMSREPHGVTVAEIIQTRWTAAPDAHAIARALSVPSLSTLFRDKLEAMRAQLQAVAAP